jgi:hypothetical protein
VGQQNGAALLLELDNLVGNGAGDQHGKWLIPL